MAASGDTFVSAMLGLAGGANVFAAGGERYPVITPGALRDADPARVFLSSEPFPFTEKHAAELAGATGLPLERFVLADGELLSWHGSRTAPGIDYAEELLTSP
jgi:ABC-type Fe3+-hydroxamate transport system substrate-binding protein